VRGNDDPAHGQPERAREDGEQHRRAQAVVAAAGEDAGHARLVEVVAGEIGGLAVEEGAVHGPVELVPAVPIVTGAVHDRPHVGDEAIDAVLEGGVAAGVAAIAGGEDGQRQQRVRVSLLRAIEPAERRDLGRRERPPGGERGVAVAWPQRRGIVARVLRGGRRPGRGAGRARGRQHQPGEPNRRKTCAGHRDHRRIFSRR